MYKCTRMQFVRQRFHNFLAAALRTFSRAEINFLPTPHTPVVQRLDLRVLVASPALGFHPTTTENHSFVAAVNYTNSTAEHALLTVCMTSYTALLN